MRAVRGGAVHSWSTSPSVPALAIMAVLAVIYLRWTPLAPDLAAQVARADAIRHGGVTTWWTGWFGGISLPTYSLFVPSWMAAVGVRLTGVLAALAAAAGGAQLARDARRPRAGAIAFALAIMADLVDGRVTFAAGLAIGVWALFALRERWHIRGLVLTIAAYGASPLVALFLGIILTAVVIADPPRRRQAAVSAGALLVLGGVMTILFPGTGTMPFKVLDAVPAALCCAVVTVLCPQRVVRVSAAVLLASFPLFLLVPGAVGGNITRLSWVCTVPIVVACSALPTRLLAGAAALLSLWPAGDLVGQLSSGHDSSAEASYYQGLITHLRASHAAAGPAAVGERLEVVDTANHWATVYMSSESLARGWDRQVDHAENPIFYRDEALTAASYHNWLRELAVGWVALPAAPLDYASVAEGKLIRGGLGYLHLVWSDARWKLYRVADPTPLATGAQVTAVTSGGISLFARTPGTVFVRLRWSPYLVAEDPVTSRPVISCISNEDGWVRLGLPSAGPVRLTSDFTPAARLRGGDPDCDVSGSS